MPMVWNEVRDERIGDDPHFNLLVDRDYPVEDVQENVVPLDNSPGQPGSGFAVCTDFTDADLSRVVCEVNVSKENRRGAMLTNRLADQFDRVGRGVALLVFTTLAMMLGAVAGGLLVGGADRVVGSAQRASNASHVGAVCGAILFGVLGVRRLMRLRRKSESGRPGNDLNTRNSASAFPDHSLATVLEYQPSRAGFQVRQNAAGLGRSVSRRRTGWHAREPCGASSRCGIYLTIASVRGNSVYVAGCRATFSSRN